MSNAITEEAAMLSPSKQQQTPQQKNVAHIVNNNNNGSNSNSTIKDINLSEIPAIERYNLCLTMDKLNIWHALALRMGYKDADIQEMQRRAQQRANSPSDELLMMYSEQNHTITELFVLLHSLQQYTAMSEIQNLVDKKYHRLILSGQPDLSHLISRLGRSEKILNGPPNSDTVSNSNNQSSSFVLDTSTTSSKNSSNRNLNIKKINEYASTIPKIDYQELVDATTNWNPKNILGKGGFGTVFKGLWKYTDVAIKKIENRGSGSTEENKKQLEQSLNELKFLNSCRHDNILPLYGYSINGDEPCLYYVYQLMTGGSLEERLYTKKFPPLKWEDRLNIARGTARGLQFLHTFREKPLIHGDIKPANILLDSCSQPKIGDFGLAREGPHALNASMEVSRVYGTKPYLPGEFLGYRTISTKVDTYSFGVVLLELVTGLRAYDRTREQPYLTKHIAKKSAEDVRIQAIMDKNVQIDPNGVDICQNLISLAGICVADRPGYRPEMVTVLSRLE